MADVSDLRIERPAPGARQASPARFAIGALFALLFLAAGAGGTWLLQYRSQHSGEHVPANPSAPGNNAGSNSTQSQSTRNESTSAFTAAGYVEVIPPGARVISALLPGMLNDIRVREGHAVRAGEVVATLDTSLLEQELARSTAEVNVLQARLARMEAGYLPEEITKARARVTAAAEILRIAEASLDNTRELAKSGVVSRRIVIQSEIEVVEAARAFAEAEADLKMMLRGARPEDLTIARAELARAEADLDYTKWKLRQCDIASPVSGVVFQQLAQPGQWLAAESAIISVFDPTSLQAWVDVNQRDLSRIRIGQRATMIADAAPSNAIEGKVVQLMPRASIERNTVRIKLSIEGEHEDLRPDMSLRVIFHEE